jgi:hypothetical protein
MLELTANCAQQQLILTFAQRLESARHGEKKTILAEVQQSLCWSKDKFYRELKALGWNSGRKKRKDSGSTCLSDDTINHAAALLATGTRANGKQIMELPNAASILTANGFNVDCSTSTLRRVLRSRQASAKQLAAPTAHVQLKSLHPNHVHQVDPSLCLLYYPPGRQGKIQKFMDDDDFYKNKPQNLEKVANLRVWRYVLTDHTSGTIRVRYFEAAGENSMMLYQFLLWAWGEHNDSRCPMRGLPNVLLMDKGSANQSIAMKRALRALDVELLDHKAKNARAKGQVENANNLVEKLFESRILLEPVHSVEELNQKAEAWQNAYNANTIPGYDAIHGRHGMARYENWLTIRSYTTVRELPAPEVCRWLLTHKPETRKVARDLSISATHPCDKRSRKYDLSSLAGIYVGLEVLVTPLVLSGDAELLVYCTFQNAEQCHQVKPVALDHNGFVMDGAVIGAEFKAKPDTAMEKARKQALQTAFPNLTEEEIAKARQKKATPFDGKLDALSHLQDAYNPTYMPVKGEQVETGFEAPNQVRLQGLGLIQAALHRLNRPLTPDENQWLRAAGEVVETELDSLLMQMNRQMQPKPSLRAV